jgi:hypothetical protein
MEKVKERKSESWEVIKQRYPDSFVLLENPEFEREQILKGGIFLYKHKNRKKVYQKESELRPYYSTILYTGGIRGDRINENTLLL